MTEFAPSSGSLDAATDLVAAARERLCTLVRKGPIERRDALGRVARRCGRAAANAALQVALERRELHEEKAPAPARDGRYYTRTQLVWGPRPRRRVGLSPADFGCLVARADVSQTALSAELGVEQANIPVWIKKGPPPGRQADLRSRLTRRVRDRLQAARRAVGLTQEALGVQARLAATGHAAQLRMSAIEADALLASDAEWSQIWEAIATATRQRAAQGVDTEPELTAAELSGLLADAPISQREFARRLGVTSSVVSSWLNGYRVVDGRRVRGRKPIPARFWRSAREVLADAQPVPRRDRVAEAAVAVLELVAQRPGILRTEVHRELDRFGEGTVRAAVHRALATGKLKIGGAVVTLASGGRRNYTSGLYPAEAAVPEIPDCAPGHLVAVVAAVKARPGRSARDVADRLRGIEAHAARAAVDQALEDGLVVAVPTVYVDGRGARRIRDGLYLPQRAPAAPAASAALAGRRWARTWRKRLRLGRRELSLLLAGELGVSEYTVRAWQERGVPDAWTGRVAAALERAQPVTPETRRAAVSARLLELIQAAPDGMSRRSLRPRLAVADRPLFDAALGDALVRGELYERPARIRDKRSHLRLFPGPVPAEWEPGEAVDREELRELVVRAGVASSQAAELLGVASRSDFSSWLSGKQAAPRGWWSQMRRLPELAGAQRAAAESAELAPIPGPALRRLRKARGWSQLELARRVHVSQPVVGRWERSSEGVPVEHLAAVREALAGGEPPAVGEWARSLARARAAAGLRQADVGRRVGVAGGTISAWESGRALPSRERRADVERVLAASWPAAA